jgi:hypothetical protein
MLLVRFYHDPENRCSLPNTPMNVASKIDATMKEILKTVEYVARSYSCEHVDLFIMKRHVFLLTKMDKKWLIKHGSHPYDFIKQLIMWSDHGQ